MCREGWCMCDSVDDLSRTQMEMSRMNLKFSDTPSPHDKENTQKYLGISSSPKPRQPLGVISTNTVNNLMFPSPDKLVPFSPPKSDSPSVNLYSLIKSSGFCKSEEEDTSQDSGYAGSVSDERRFLRPASSARRHSIAFLSNSSNQSSEEDGFEHVLQEIDVDENAQMSSEVSNLLSAPLKHVENEIKRDYRKPSFRRCLSMVDEQTPARRVKSCLFGSPSSDRSLKRAENCESISPANNKRSRVEASPFYPSESGVGRPVRRSNSSPVDNAINFGAKRFMQRSVSDTEATIIYALKRASDTDSNLIGDFSVSHALPLVRGKCTDLKNINCQTVAELVRGEHKDKIKDFKILDCRYPYEYKGGHIKGAVNPYTKEEILKMIPEETCKKVDDKEDSKRSILIFHCEFSSERGPNLCRFLRNKDREANLYPYLHYPEIYVLDGGYRAFFQQFPELCEPKAYLQMLDPNHGADLKHFRAKSKSWGSDLAKSRMGGPSRTNFKRML